MTEEITAVGVCQKLRVQFSTICYVFEKSTNLNDKSNRTLYIFFTFFINSWNELSNIGGHLSELLIGNKREDQTLTLRSMGNELVVFSLCFLIIGVKYLEIESINSMKIWSC
jgi:hypothetical protein